MLRPHSATWCRPAKRTLPAGGGPARCPLLPSEPSGHNRTSLTSGCSLLGGPGLLDSGSTPRRCVQHPPTPPRGCPERWVVRRVIAPVGVACSLGLGCRGPAEGSLIPVLGPETPILAPPMGRSQSRVTSQSSPWNHRSSTPIPTCRPFLQTPGWARAWAGPGRVMQVKEPLLHLELPHRWPVGWPAGSQHQALPWGSVLLQTATAITCHLALSSCPAL